MIQIRVYSDIANHKDGIFMSMLGVEDSVFSADALRDIFEEYKDETDFKFNIHCDGGSVSEGLAIYDIMRTSGKNIHTNIDGSCHSMAIVLLLGAPFENRTSNYNSRSLIHPVMACTYGSMNSDQLRDLADEVEVEQNAILDIYEDRTGTDREVLANLMKEEKQRTSKELLTHGFISKINNYTTNKKTKNMSKSKAKGGLSLENKATSLLGRIRNLLNSAVNYDHTDSEGEVLFTTDSETDVLEVGMPAAPDGVFTIPDGRTITISDGEVVDIEEVNDDSERVEELENALAEASELINSLKNELGSGYQVRNRTTAPGKNNKGGLSSADRKKEANDKRNKWKGSK